MLQNTKGVEDAFYMLEVFLYIRCSQLTQITLKIPLLTILSL